MFWLLLGLIILAGVFFWAAARPGVWASSQVQLRGGACILLALAGFVGYALFQESTSRSRLEKIIPVYPNASTRSWGPRVSDDCYRMLESEDDLEAVGDFYEIVAAESGWVLTRSENNRVMHLKLEKADVAVSVMALRKGNRIEITYRVADYP